MTNKKIQKVVFTTTEFGPELHCPFCGQRVLTDDPADDDEMTTPCPHTLFIATDEGFEYRHSRFDENLREQGLDEEKEETLDFSDLTDKVNLPGAIKFDIFVPMPSGFRTYIGFAPLPGG